MHILACSFHASFAGLPSLGRRRFARPRVLLHVCNYLEALMSRLSTPVSICAHVQIIACHIHLALRLFPKRLAASREAGDIT